MDDLIKEIQEVFEPDLILFDTPPVLGLQIHHLLQSIVMGCS